MFNPISKLFLVLLLVCLFCETGLMAQSASITFTVTDKNKNPISDLRAEDIRILENGKPLQIISLKQQTDQPFVLALVLDASLSFERILPSVKVVTNEFVKSFVNLNKDKIMVVSFTNKPKIEQDLTDNKEAVYQAIVNVETYVPKQGKIIAKIPNRIVLPSGSIIPPGPIFEMDPNNFTSIWDTISVVSEDLKNKSSNNETRAILIFTDGLSNGDEKKNKESVTKSIKSNVRIYSIGVSDAFYGSVDKKSLQQISDKTGGLFFAPEKHSELLDIYKTIEQSLRSFYTLTFNPIHNNSENKLHKFKIEIINPELRKSNLKISHNEGYFIVSDKNKLDK